MLIGLHGKLRSGKDTVYKRLAVQYDLLNPQRLAFADKLKQSAAAALGITVDLLERLKEEDGFIVIYTADHDIVKQINVREYLQWYGTEAHRDVFFAEFWLDAVLPLDAYHEEDFLVVTDVRFPNEVARIWDLGGVVWKVVGSEVVGDSHPSEQDFPDSIFGAVIDNTIRNDSFENVDRQIRFAMSNLSHEFIIKVGGKR